MRTEKIPQVNARKITRKSCNISINNVKIPYGNSKIQWKKLEIFMREPGIVSQYSHDFSVEKTHLCLQWEPFIYKINKYYTKVMWTLFISQDHHVGRTKGDPVSVEGHTSWWVKGGSESLPVDRWLRIYFVCTSSHLSLVSRWKHIERQHNRPMLHQKAMFMS